MEKPFTRETRNHQRKRTERRRRSVGFKYVYNCIIKWCGMQFSPEASLALGGGRARRSGRAMMHSKALFCCFLKRSGNSSCSGENFSRKKIPRFHRSWKMGGEGGELFRRKSFFICFNSPTDCSATPPKVKQKVGTVRGNYSKRRGR